MCHRSNQNVLLCLDFVSKPLDFVPKLLGFVLLRLDRVLLCLDFVLLCLDFVPKRLDFVPLCLDFVQLSKQKLLLSFDNGRFCLLGGYFSKRLFYLQSNPQSKLISKVILGFWLGIRTVLIKSTNSKLCKVKFEKIIYPQARFIISLFHSFILYIIMNGRIFQTAITNRCHYFRHGLKMF